MKLISVKERLPTDEKIKLVYNDSEEWTGGIAEWNFAWYSLRLGKWVITRRQFWTQETITHWCDLPERMKG
jgi:hypothetical protein